jgi:MarR family transcriptional regulator, organic hydroperoxide resistance regulator
MKNLCAIRDICRSISEFENEFLKLYDLCLNEGMVLCTLNDGRLTSGKIAAKLNLTCSNTSKVIRSVEDKGLIERDMGDKDRRQMYFTLTTEGKKRLKLIEKDNVALTEPLSLIITNKENFKNVY